MVEMSDIIQRAGSLKRLCQAVQRHRATVRGWTRVPPQHVQAVSEVTGIPPHELRPDLASLFDPASSQPKDAA